MPNGKPGDDWYTDIVLNGLPTLSPTADRLVVEIREMAGEPRYEPLISLVDGQLDEIGSKELASRSQTVGMEYRNLRPAERTALEQALRDLRDRLRDHAAQ